MKILRPRKPRPKGARKLRTAAGNGTTGSMQKPPITHGYYRSFDGTRLFYSIEGKGPPLVFCYGLVCSSLHWTYQIDHFQQRYKAVWYDYRGHHNSDAPKDLSSLTVQNIAADTVALLDELEIDKAVFLGHSMGVNVVLDVYRQCPERVAGMVLANGTAKRPLETMFRVNAFQNGFRILRKLHDLSPALFRKVWKSQAESAIARSMVAIGGFNPHLSAPEDIALYVKQVMEMDPRILLNLIENYNTYDATSWLHTIDVPALVIAGEQDNIIPMEQQELMQQLIPRSRFEVIRHGSHCPQMDLPELMNLRIEAFLREIGYEGREADDPAAIRPAGSSDREEPSPPKESASRSTS